MRTKGSAPQRIGICKYRYAQICSTGVNFGDSATFMSHLTGQSENCTPTNYWPRRSFFPSRDFLKGGSSA